MGWDPGHLHSIRAEQRSGREEGSEGRIKYHLLSFLALGCETLVETNVSGDIKVKKGGNWT